MADDGAPSPLLGPVREAAPQYCREYEDYLRARRRIVWDRSLTSEERKRRLRAVKNAYYGYDRDCCPGCRSVSAESVEPVLEPFEVLEPVLEPAG